MKRKLLLGGMLLTAAFGLSLTGCGSKGTGENGGADETIITGMDWRTTASFTDGTLIHNSAIDVLVSMDASKIVVYYDKPDQKVYATADLTYETTSLQQTVDSLAFIDADGDGYTDLQIDVFDQQGDAYKVSFIWDDTNKCFVEQADQNLLALAQGGGNFSLTNFIGGWVSDSENTSVVIDREYNWEMFHDDTLMAYGQAEADYGKIVLYKTDGTYWCSFVFDNENNTITEDYGVVYTFDGPIELYTEDGLLELPDADSV